MTPKYRTTKIPTYYFTKIEQNIKNSEYVSVAEFIRKAIEDKLKEIESPVSFLLFKDIIFNPDTLEKIHEIIAKVSKVEGKRKNSINITQTTKLRHLINLSLSTDLTNFLSNFLINFAKIHPFNDGNKRTSWIAIMIFLQLLDKKLNLEFKQNIESKDELFIWKNATNQINNEKMKKFLQNHIINQESKEKDPINLILKTIKENKLILNKLSR